MNSAFQPKNGLSDCKKCRKNCLKPLYRAPEKDLTKSKIFREKGAKSAKKGRFFIKTCLKVSLYCDDLAGAK